MCDVSYACLQTPMRLWAIVEERGEERTKAGGTAGLCFGPERMHLFDKAVEKHLREGGQFSHHPPWMGRLPILPFAVVKPDHMFGLRKEQPPRRKGAGDIADDREQGCDMAKR